MTETPLSTDLRSRDAILTAADFIESHPKRFDFESVNLPRHKRCGSPGCALGWVAYFWGVEDLTNTKCLNEMAQEALGMDYWGDFDSKMGESKHKSKWRESAPKCAYALRRFANKYFPKAKAS